MTLRQFGIEIECYHPTRNSSESFPLIAEAIQAMGFRARSANYTGRSYDVWQVKPDGSLRPYGQAVEIVSPIMPGTPEAIAEVARVAEWLDANGYKVNKSCGLHVHVSTTDLSAHERHAVAYRYHLCADELKSFLPKSRWNGENHFAMFLAETDRRWTKLVAAARDPNRANITSWNHGERYNPCNMEHSDRIEFRQAAGTVNARKITMWYKFLCEFVAETVRATREVSAFNATVQPQRPARTMPPVRGPRTESVVVQELPPEVPALVEGTDAHYFVSMLRRQGFITHGHARRGWPDTRLRVTANALRRLGADLVTIDGGYAVASRAGHYHQPCTDADIFTRPRTVRTRRVISTSDERIAMSENDVERNRLMAAMAQQPRRPQNIETVLRALPFNSGLSAEVQDWINDRRAVLSEDTIL